MLTPLLITADRGISLLGWDSLFVIVTRSVLTVERLALWHSVERAHYDGVKKRLNVFTLLDVGPEGVLPFSAAARKESEKMTREMSPFMRASAVVFPADGFLASGVRSVVGAVGRVATHGFPMRVFKEVPEATAWLVEASEGTLPGGFDAGAFVAEIRALRER